MMHNEVVEQYAQWMQSWAAADKTIAARTTLAHSLLSEYGLALTADDIQEYLARPKPNGQQRSRWTIATYHAHLRSFCEYLVAAGHRTESPMAEVRKARRPKSLPRPLSEAELALVLATATGRNRDWIVLALDAGLRAHEIAKLAGGDVTPAGIFVRGKGGVEAVLPDHPDIRAMATRYPATGYWFPSPYGGHIKAETVSATISVLFTSLGIAGSIHRVRHNYGTRLLRAGVNIRRVQKLMRHANLETTALYTAVDEDELREAINLLPSSA
jgi:integrase/recombinase XerD